MKKRLLVLFCAAVMVMGMTVSAAGSITAEEIQKAQEEAAKDKPADVTVAITEEKITVEVTGSTVKVEVPVKAEERKAAADTATQALATKDDTIVIKPVEPTKIHEIAKIATKIAEKAKAASKIETKFVIDLHADAPQTFTFNVTLSANEVAYLYHYLNDASIEIQKCDSTASTVSAKLSTYSTVALVVVTEEPAAVIPDPVVNTTETVVKVESPKTGDVFSLVVAVAAIAGTGVVGLRKRENEN